MSTVLLSRDIALQRAVSTYNLKEKEKRKRENDLFAL
jgi:hypothetical protein